METWQAMEKMIRLSRGNVHDVEHFLKVFALASSLGRAENLSLNEQNTLELAALVHDIACPLCRAKYGSATGKLQEKESEEPVREFFRGENISPEKLERIVSLVSRHHTYDNVDGNDLRILLEADFLVNAMENGLSPEAMSKGAKKIVRNASAARLLNSISEVTGQ